MVFKAWLYVAVCLKFDVDDDVVVVVDDDVVVVVDDDVVGFAKGVVH